MELKMQSQYNQYGRFPSNSNNLGMSVNKSQMSFYPDVNRMKYPDHVNSDASSQSKQEYAKFLQNLFPTEDEFLLSEPRNQNHLFPVASDSHFEMDPAFNPAYPSRLNPNSANFLKQSANQVAGNNSFDRAGYKNGARLSLFENVNPSLHGNNHLTPHIFGSIEQNKPSNNPVLENLAGNAMYPYDSPIGLDSVFMAQKPFADLKAQSRISTAGSLSTSSSFNLPSSLSSGLMSSVEPSQDSVGSVDASKSVGQTLFGNSSVGFDLFESSEKLTDKGSAHTLFAQNAFAPLSGNSQFPHSISPSGFMAPASAQHFHALPSVGSTKHENFFNNQSASIESKFPWNAFERDEGPLNELM